MVPEHASEFNPWTRDEAVALFFDYLLQGRMQVSDLVTHRYAPREAPAVYRELVSDRSNVMGAIFDWSRLG
jgi:threonine dehydrogenase-like Zn-dependent dehydrogenase